MIARALLLGDVDGDDLGRGIRLGEAPSRGLEQRLNEALSEKLGFALQLCEAHGLKL